MDFFFAIFTKLSYPEGGGNHRICTLPRIVNTLFLSINDCDDLNSSVLFTFKLCEGILYNRRELLRTKSLI